MSSHPDADAFVQAILRDPAEITTRLVFADWLEETDDPSNVAWARYIRLMANADQVPQGSANRFQLNRKASELASEITATLKLDVEQLVGKFEHLHQLLPQPNFTVTVAGYPLIPDVVEMIPESVAQENCVIALAREGARLVLAAANPNDVETRRRLEFILNIEEMRFVGVTPEVVEAAIDHSYGRWPLDSIDTCLGTIDLEEVTATARVYYEPVYQPHPIGVLLYKIFFEVIKLKGTRVQIGPASDRAEMRYLLADEWVLRDALPLRLLGPLADEIARVAGLYPELEELGLAAGTLPETDNNGIIYTIQVLITNTGQGPIIDLYIGTRPPDEDGW